MVMTVVFMVPLAMIIVVAGVVVIVREWSHAGMIWWKISLTESVGCGSVGLQRRANGMRMTKKRRFPMKLLPTPLFLLIPLFPRWSRCTVG